MNAWVSKKVSYGGVVYQNGYSSSLYNDNNNKTFWLAHFSDEKIF